MPLASIWVPTSTSASPAAKRSSRRRWPSRPRVVSRSKRSRRRPSSSFSSCSITRWVPAPKGLKAVEPQWEQRSPISARWSHQWQRNHWGPSLRPWTVSATSQFGQSTTSPQLRQLRKLLWPRRGTSSTACSPRSARLPRRCIRGRLIRRRWPSSSSNRMSTKRTGGRGRPPMRSGRRSNSVVAAGPWQVCQVSSDGVALPSTRRAPLRRARCRATSRA